MSTRSVLLIYSNFTEYDWEKREESLLCRPIARIYRHCDGYPDGHGLDICKSLAMVDAYDYTNLNYWTRDFLKRYFVQDFNVEMEPPAGEGQFCHGDLDYVYRLTGCACDGEWMSADGVRMEMFEVSWQDDLGEDYSGLKGREPRFDGSWKDFPAFLRNLGGKCVLDAQYDVESWFCNGADMAVWAQLKMLSHNGYRADGHTYKGAMLL